MKLVLLLVVLLVVVAWVMARGHRNKRSKAPPSTPDSAGAGKPAEMLACSHCGLHLPRADAAFDVAGRPFCSAEHRVSGPR